MSKYKIESFEERPFPNGPEPDGNFHREEQLVEIGMPEMNSIDIKEALMVRPSNLGSEKRYLPDAIKYPATHRLLKAYGYKPKISEQFKVYLDPAESSPAMEVSKESILQSILSAATVKVSRPPLESLVEFLNKKGFKCQLTLLSSSSSFSLQYSSEKKVFTDFKIRQESSGKVKLESKYRDEKFKPIETTVNNLEPIIDYFKTTFSVDLKVPKISKGLAAPAIIKELKKIFVFKNEDWDKSYDLSVSYKGITKKYGLMEEERELSIESEDGRYAKYKEADWKSFEGITDIIYTDFWEGSGHEKFK